VSTEKVVVYSGRNRPDLTPVYKLFEALTGTAVEVAKVYHHDVGDRVVAERSDPQADVLLTNSQLALEQIRDADVFEPYAPPVARDYEEWLRAPDFAWLSFTAWPRVAMINRTVLTEAEWPTRLEDLADPALHDQIACAALVEMTTVAQFAAIRHVRSDEYTEDLIDRLIANGLRIYASNLFTRNAVAEEKLAAALANSSNVHVFQLEGNPVGEAWLDQGEGELGTPIEAHTVAVLKNCRRPEAARDLVDFLLSTETQSMLARLFGETPVNPAAEHGWVRSLAQIRRTEAPLAETTALLPSTVELLRRKGFDVKA